MEVILFLRELDDPNLRLQLDVFHMQQIQVTFLNKSGTRLCVRGVEGECLI